VVAKNIIIVDLDSKRRAAIGYMLSSRNIHVEPFEHPEELANSWRGADVALVSDEAGFVKSVARLMAARASWLPLVAYAAEPTPRRVADAVLDGAIDYLEWPGREEDVIEVLTGAEARARTQPMRERLAREASAQSRLDGLSRRERQVLACVADGLNNRLIGRRLGISARTVEIHRAHILEKTEARGTPEVIRLAVEAGFMLENHFEAPQQQADGETPAQDPRQIEVPLDAFLFDPR